MNVRKSAIIAVFVATFLSFAVQAPAGVILEAGIRGVYEDNITASAADIGKDGDYYTVAHASFGGYKGVGNDAYMFLRGDASGYLYRRYSDLNAAVVGLSSGVYKDFSDSLSAEAGLRLTRKEYGESDRDSTSYGASFMLKQEIAPVLWVKGGYEFEKNIAADDIFSYSGHLMGIWSGYSVSPKTDITLGYSYLLRTYDEPAGFSNRFHTVSLGATRQIAPKVRLSGSYNRQYNSSNIPGTSHTNNIFILGVSYSF